MSITFNPYLNFNGNTRDAMEFYHQIFGGTLELTTFGEMPDVPSIPAYKDKIMHALLQVDDITLMATEARPDRPAVFGDNVSLSFSGTDRPKLTHYFKSLLDGGEVGMELQPMPWGAYFGEGTDKFGVHWMVNISNE
ncbi:VOC family protein [Candidatus Saccharibacteria bacterium]|nr:VOC family protein [Candidatus Saccharibacteria bacterium]